MPFGHKNGHSITVFLGCQRDISNAQYTIDFQWISNNYSYCKTIKTITSLFFCLLFKDLYALPFEDLGSRASCNPSPKKLKDRIKSDFGSEEVFKKQFIQAGITQFGSGWCWLSIDNGKLVVSKTPNAENTLIHDMKPVLGCDLWEHSYYVDYKNRRPEYLENFYEKLINWEFVESNLD